MNRRHFLAAGTASALLATTRLNAAIPADRLARIGISSSTFRANYDGRFSSAGALPRLSHRSFPAFVKAQFGVTKVELWDQQFGPAGHSFAECRAIRAAADAAGVQVISVEVEDMARIDAGDPDDQKQAVAEGIVWLEKARVLGCSSMRFNVNRLKDELNQDAAIAVLRKLADHGRRLGIIVLLENHGGATAAVSGLVALVKAVGHPFLKAELDWGAWSPPGDRYEAMRTAMPVTHIVSAKGLAFDPDTYVHTSYDVAQLVREAEATGFRGVYSVELYNTPAPADTNRAVQSFIDTITSQMR
ncbi:MAG: TIM barrel protein [Sphingomonadales bacterium]|jgi:sugar phosphate isomerase/epimerase